MHRTRVGTRRWAMKSRRLFNSILVALLATALGPALARAQDAQTAQSAQNEPTPGVGRVSLIHGDVTVQRGDTGDWQATTINAPLVRGDRIATGNDSRAEVQLDYANVLRLDHNSEVKVADITRDRIQLQLAQGTADVAVFKGTQANLEVDTPNMAVEPQGEGTYRIQVDSPELTEVIVRSGQAQVSTPQGSTTVKENEGIKVEGANTPQYKVAEAPRRDDWDQWNRDRDKAILDAQSYRYTNRYYTGAQDLDRYGSWTQVPGYDWCWTPYVNAGWVPYRDGRWVWEPFYGWTWVSYEPWGWAPYHYGRWMYWGGNWCWWPGYVTAGYYPLWAPAYVSFLGFGYGRWNFGFGFGYGYRSIGWCPLGPRDRFQRWWGRGDSFNSVSITNITNINRTGGSPRGVTRFRGREAGGSNLQAVLHNNHIRSAITVTSTQNFVDGRVPRNPGTVQLATLRTAHVVEGTLPAVPTRQSLRAVNRPAQMAGVPGRAARGESFFTRQRPPAGPQPFTERAAGIRRMVETHNAVAGTQTAPGAAGRATVAERAGIAASRGQAGASGERAVSRRFGSQSAVPAAASRQPATPNRAQVTSNAASRFPAAAPRSTRRSADGWRAFGGQNSGAAAPQGGASRPAAAPRSNRVTGAPQASPRQSQAGQQGWRRFSDAPRGTSRQPAAAPASGARSRGGQAPRNFSPRPAPSAPQRQPSQGWRQFNPQPRSSAPQADGSGQAARPGWNRFPSNSRGERNSGWNAPAPRSNRRYNQPSRGYERPPLQIRKPIVVERSPRNYGGGNQGSWGGRSASPRSYGGGNRGGWGGRGGGGHSAPQGRSGGSHASSSHRGHGRG
jgi:Family of unknown function (DUF6600)/FecR protein